MALATIPTYYRMQQKSIGICIIESRDTVRIAPTKQKIKLQIIRIFFFTATVCLYNVLPQALMPKEIVRVEKEDGAKIIRQNWVLKDGIVPNRRNIIFATLACIERGIRNENYK